MDFLLKPARIESRVEHLCRHPQRELEESVTS